MLTPWQSRSLALAGAMAFQIGRFASSPKLLPLVWHMLPLVPLLYRDVSRGWMGIDPLVIPRCALACLMDQKCIWSIRLSMLRARPSPHWYDLASMRGDNVEGFVIVGTLCTGRSDKCQVK